MALLLSRRELGKDATKVEALTEPDTAPENSCLAQSVRLTAASPLFIRLLSGLVTTLSLQPELYLQFFNALLQASDRWITSQSKSGKSSWSWSCGCGGGGGGGTDIPSLDLPKLTEFEFEFGDEVGDVGRVFGPGLQVL